MMSSYLPHPKLGCGSCGMDKFKLFKQVNDKGFFSECVGCSSVTFFSVSEPEIRIDWPSNGFKSEGIACVFSSNKEFLHE